MPPKDFWDYKPWEVIGYINGYNIRQEQLDLRAMRTAYCIMMPHVDPKKANVVAQAVQGVFGIGGSGKTAEDARNFRDQAKALFERIEKRKQAEK